MKCLLFILTMMPIVCSANQSIIELFRKYERKYHIPPYLAYAIATQESGRQQGQQFAPWPWTINIAGKGRYFASKATAIKAAKTALQKGQSFGGGLMQQEWRWQKQRYQRPEDVFDPEINVKTGVQILREWYDKTGSWVEAIARYHVGYVSDKKELRRALNYVDKVRRYHDALVGR